MVVAINPNTISNSNKSNNLNNFIITNNTEASAMANFNTSSPNYASSIDKDKNEAADALFGLSHMPTPNPNTNPIITNPNQITMNTNVASSTNATKNNSKPRLSSKMRLDMAILYKEIKSNPDLKAEQKNNHLYEVGISKFGLTGNRQSILRRFHRTYTDQAKLQVEVDSGNGESKGIYKSIPESHAFVIPPPANKTEQMMAMDRFVENTKKLTEGNQDCSKFSDKINGAFRVKFNDSPKIEAFMEEMKGIDKDTPSYKQIQSYITDTIISHSKFVNKNPSVESFDLLIQTCKTSPQPIHCDVPRDYNQKIITYGTDDLINAPIISGIMTLLPNSEGPIIYNMSGVKQPDSPEDFLSAWDGIVEKHTQDDLKNALQLQEKANAMQLIKQYGILMFAKEDRRCFLKKLKKYSILLFEGNLPHHGPGSDDFRAVIFFTVRLEESATEYSNLQMTQEKLIFMLYEDIRDEISIDSIRFLFTRLANFIVESALRGTTRDVTFEEQYMCKGLINNWNHLIKSALNMKREPSDKHKNELETAKHLLIIWACQREMNQQNKRHKTG
jgi:hypothetical protein